MIQRSGKRKGDGKEREENGSGMREENGRMGRMKGEVVQEGERGRKGKRGMRGGKIGWDKKNCRGNG